MLRHMRAGFVLVLTTLILPAAVLGLGLWQQQRAPAHQQEIAAQRVQIAREIAALQAERAESGTIPFTVQFRKDGKLYGGPYALTVAEEERNRLDRAVLITRLRAPLPLVVVFCAALVLALSLLTLIGAALLGAAGRRSRDALERGFDLVRRLLPALLGTLVVTTAIGVIAAVAFEVAPLAELDNPTTGEFKLVAIAVIVMGFSLWTAGKAVFNLRSTLALFQPDPLEISGRSVSREAAPGLWRWVEGLAEKLGALHPDRIVVGLTGGFFVTSGPKLLWPSGESFTGRTLYLPLPYLPLLRQDESEAIIGHELGHFTGGDTEYSLRFLPIYAGVNRSLAAMVLAGRGADGSDGFITRPAIELGLYVMERFDRAVQYWSRLREFAADEAGARITSPEAQGRALLRHGGVTERVGEVLGAAFREPQAAPADLVAAAFEHAQRHGFEDSDAHAEQRAPHPTDTHPPRHQRLAALGITPDAALLDRVASPPDAEALPRVASLFAAPDQLFQTLTADFVDNARAAHRAHRNSLQAAIGSVAEDEVAVRDSAAAAGWFILPVGLLFAAMAIGVKLQQRQFPEGADIIAGVTGAIAVLFFGIGLRMVLRGARPFVTLSPRTVWLDGVDRPIAWAEIEQVGYHIVGPANRSKGLRFTVHLEPGSAMPKRAKGRRAKIKDKQRTIRIDSSRLQGMTAHDFAERIHQYRVADHARIQLEQQEAALAAAIGPEPIE
ncbi:M48 family metalloprotease [Sphingomonas sp. MMS12-HWE2-04]|uniref:M48 family metalloprotease n=1 Tax=Sphingomonas sp. MMS12-HWE2-04 TaxID=3234199 RepID=UPI00385179DD